ncbi:hypothetical protein AVEN_178375-1 [Araneus ventricosus]|uniref:Uncharacterized protein n=1 Tax=Araneus ventricosus TaxID=182803 RepID=A0A4Y2BCD0_ARAVE|nr:hypothetical protein AVEN_178375-1 [Araneus ventricosus]
MEFLTIWKIPGMSRIFPATTEMRATTSSAESTGLVHQCLQLTPAEKAQVPHYAGTTMSGATTEEHVLRGKRSSYKRRAMPRYRPQLHT